jgi:hypothetical protein
MLATTVTLASARNTASTSRVTRTHLRFTETGEFFVGLVANSSSPTENFHCFGDASGGFDYLVPTDTGTCSGTDLY